MKALSALALATVLVLPSAALAHTPLFSCYDMGDGTLECEGGFSNGNSAAGIKVVVTDASGQVIKTTVLDENSLIVLEKPKGDYSVMMDGGEGHKVTVKSQDITE